MASGPCRQWRADSGGGGRGYNTVKGPANYCLSPRVGYTRIIYIRNSIHELQYIYTWSAGPFNISQIRVTFSRNRFPGPVLCIYILYACYMRGPENSIVVKYFSLLEGCPPQSSYIICICVLSSRRFASPVYCLLSCGTGYIYIYIYRIRYIRCPSTRSDDFPETETFTMQPQQQQCERHEDERLWIIII